MLLFNKVYKILQQDVFAGESGSLFSACLSSASAPKRFRCNGLAEVP